MAVKIVGGETVPLTPEEETQLSQDQAAAAAAASVREAEAANEQTIRGAIDGRLASLRTARDAITGGTLFAGLSTNERNLLLALVNDDIGIGRLLLHKLDGTT